MKTTLLSILFASSVATVFAQPPAVLQITRETIKEGKAGAHRKTEREFVASFRKNKFPYYYIALTTESGANEVWFLDALPSFAALEDSDQLSNKEPLKTEIESADARDGDLRLTSRSMTAVFRPDLSYLPPNSLALAKLRYMMIASYRVRLGHDEDFMAGGKQIIDAYKKAKFDSAVITYQVATGVPEGLYLLMFPMASLKELDEQPAREKALVEAMGADNFQRLMKGAGDMFQTMDSTLFAVSPEMSYVSKETEDADPGFWRPKTSSTSVSKSKATTGQ